MRLGPALAITLALVLIGLSVTAQGQRARLVGSFAWSMDEPWFGGFSGLTLSGDGASMTVLSDRSVILTARIIRDGDRISAIRPGRPIRLRSSTGKRLIGHVRDSEGLAIAPDGTTYISFERVHRVARYDDLTGPAKVLPRPREFRAMRFNGSLEALAVDAKGRLYTLPEDGVGRNGLIPLYRWDGKVWSRPFFLPARGDFLPVGADFGPDGRFYLLERTYGLFGFRSRLRSWDLTGTAALDERTLLETGAGTHGNLEGLSVWRDAAGRLRATMVADDNFNRFQKTELVEYILTE